MTTLYPTRTAVVCAAGARRPEAAALAERLGVPCLTAPPRETDRLLLVFDEGGLGIRSTAPDAPGTVRAEFVAGRGGWRGRHSTPAHEALARAAGIRAGHRPDIIDATAGLGRDGFLLASFGCRVQMVERHPVVSALLADGLARAAAAPRTTDAVGRIARVEGDAREILARRTADVVLVDPMHPPRRKSAAVRKEMRVLGELLGADPDSMALFEAALTAARGRVVVKRPAGAPALDERTRSGSVEGRSTRFDIHQGRAGSAPG